MNRSKSVSGWLAVCFLFALGCGSGDDVASDDSSALTGGDGQSVEAEGDIGSAEQAITMPVETPGPAGQCIAACNRISTTNITGVCCTCNGATKTFSRSPTITNLYLCK